VSVSSQSTTAPHLCSVKLNSTKERREISSERKTNNMDSITSSVYPTVAPTTPTKPHGPTSSFVTPKSQKTLHRDAKSKKNTQFNGQSHVIMSLSGLSFNDRLNAITEPSTSPMDIMY